MEYDLIVSDITSEDSFSYSCSKLQIFSEIRNKSDSNPDEGKATVNTFLTIYLFIFLNKLLQ